MTRQNTRITWGHVFVLLLCAFLGCTHAEPDQERGRRIVSMAPSTTEILFALGLGDRVVGVTRYCDFPASTVEIAKVGGIDPNYEEIVALQPDLTILLASHRDAKMELERLGMRTLSTPHKTVADVRQAICLIGEACDAKDQADAVLDDLGRRTQAVQRAIEGLRRPRVLICIGRDTDSGELAGMYVAGPRGFHAEIMEMAGGVNACDEETIAYPQLSAEGVLQLNPDVIIDLVSGIGGGAKSPEETREQWNRLRTVSAVRDGRVYVIVGTHALRPGPRYVEFLEQLARLLHPDSFAESNADD